MYNIYKNTNINFNNGQDYYYCKKNENKNINDELNELFKNNNIINRIKVNITTKDKNFNTTLIGKTKYKLITLDNMIIDIKDVINIKKID